VNLPPEYSVTDSGLPELAVDASPNGIAVCDESGTILFVNRQIEALFGYTPGELVGRTIDTLLPSASRAACAAECSRLWCQPDDRALGISLELLGCRRDGTEFPLEIGLTVAVRGDQRLVVASVVDITGRLERQNAVLAKAAEQSQRLETALADVQRLREQLARENVHLRQEVRTLAGRRDVVAESPAVRALLAQIESVAPTHATVLITGETGCGKEVFAQAIHDISARRNRPMVRVNCAAIPAALIESELFGRERGAYTGALSKQLGRFELAEGSTLFLDEIGELPLESQVKLLRVIQDRVLERLGSPRPVNVDVRLIAATNRNLERAVSERQFREDLYYRLNVFPIHVPPLRERVEDIPALVWAFVDEFAKASGKTIESIAKDSIADLQRYRWPGNVRELRNLIERSVILSRGPHLTIEVPPITSRPEAANDRLADMEAGHIRSVLERARWRIRGHGGAAQLLGMKPTTLDSRMAKLGIQRPRT
jgi:PAS domain S-box-containing protein